MSGMANWKAKIELDIKDLQKQLIDADEKIDKFANEDRKVKLDIDTKTLESAIQKLDKMLDSLGKGTGDFKQFENLSKELSGIVSDVKNLSKAFGKVDDSGAKSLLSSIQNIDRSLSELSQHILNVNKNMSNMGGNTNGAVKQVENIGNAAADAVKQVDKLAEAQSKLGGNKTNISLGDSKEQSTEIDLYHNLEKKKVTYDEIIDKIQTIVSLKEKEKSLSKTSDDTKLYQNLYDENDVNWAGDTEGTINRISDRLKEIYTKYNGKISLIDENDIQEATYLLDILKGAGESPNLNKSQEKFYQNKKFSNDSLFDNIRVDSQKAGEIDKINTELSETYRWFNQLEGVSLNENIANEIKSLISDMQIGGKTANEYANDLLKIFNIEVGSNSAVEQQNKLQSELKETELQAEKTAQAVKEAFNGNSDYKSQKKGMKLEYFDGYTDKYDESINSYEQNVVRVVETTDKFAVDAEISCAKAETAVQKFVDSIGNQFPGLQSELNSIKENMSELSDLPYADGANSFGFEPTSDGKGWYVYLNVLKEVQNQIAKTEQAIKDVSSTLSQNPKKDAFQGDNIDTSTIDKVEVKLDNSVISAKELDKALDGINIPTNGFDDVLSKLDRTKSELVDIVKITKSWVADAEGKGHEAYTLKDSRGSSEIYGISSKTDKGQILRQNIVQYDASSISKAKSEQDKLTEAMAKGREQSEKARQAEEKRQELAQNNAINKALEEEYKERQKLAEATEKEIQKNKELALSYTESASKKLSDAISKYSYGDTSDATSMMKQMNRGLSNFGDFSNIKGNISNFDSIIQNIISDLKRSHEESLKAINEEIKAESQLQNQKDSFYKSNLSAIDLEIKKREEEAKAFSNSLKAQMEAQQKAESQLQSYDTRLESYNKKTSGYDATIKRFDDGGWTSDTYLRNVQAVKDAVKEYESILNNLKNHPELVTEKELNKLDEKEKLIKENIVAVQNMSAAEKGFTKLDGQKTMNWISQQLKDNSKMSREAKNQIRAYYAQIESGNPTMSLAKIRAEVLEIVNAEEQAGRAGRTLWDTLKNSGFHQIAAQMAGMFGVYDVINVVKEGINTVRELDTAMTEVRKVSDATEAQYASFRDTISSTAKEIASTNKELLNSSADFLRLGYSLEQAEDLAKNATLFVNVGDGVDITEATEDMITAMKAFDIQAEDSIKIVDDYNQIGNKYALSATDIGEAMKRSASALEVGNNSFEESIGLITAMNEIVQNSENTGNSLKTLSLRLRGAKAELEDMGEDTDGLCDSTSKLREQVKALSGVDIMEDDNTFKSTAQQVKELGEAFVKLDDVSQAALLEIIAGKSRSNAVAALLKNYQQIDNVIADLDDAEGSALRENEAIVDSIDGRIKVLSATAEEFWQKFIDTDFVKNAVSLASDLLGLLTQIIDKFGTLPTIATGIGAAFSFKNVGEWNYISKFHSNNIICLIV